MGGYALSPLKILKHHIIRRKKDRSLPFEHFSHDLLNYMNKAYSMTRKDYSSKLIEVLLRIKTWFSFLPKKLIIAVFPSHKLIYSSQTPPTETKESGIWCSFYGWKDHSFDFLSIYLNSSHKTSLEEFPLHEDPCSVRLLVLIKV